MTDAETLHSPLQLLWLWGSCLLIPSCRLHVPQAAEGSDSRCLPARAQLPHKTCLRILPMGTLACKILFWKVEGIFRGIQGKLASILVKSCLVSQEQAFPLTLSLSQFSSLIWFNNIQTRHAKSSLPALKSFIWFFCLSCWGFVFVLFWLLIIFKERKQI